MSTRLLLVAITFLVLFVLNAYVCDDAFLTFRCVDNFVRGDGLRWNVAERVQVFTNPLQALLVAAAYAISGGRHAASPTHMYWTALAVNAAVSLTALSWLTIQLGSTRTFWIVFGVLMSSQAFVTFTSSGLETPLVYLFLILFFVPFLRGIDLERPTAFFFPFLWAALGVVNRIDTTLLFLPGCALLLLHGVRRHGRKLVPPLLLASVPVVLWFSGALVYYGFLLPNSYYAKVGLEVDRSVLLEMGSAWLQLAWLTDPVTPLVVALGVLLGWTDARARATALGALAYVGYVVWIGGDFIGFRFLAPPFLLGVLLVHHFLTRREVEFSRRVRSLAAICILGYGMLWPSSPLRTWHDGPSAPDVRYYYEASSPTRWRPGRGFPFAPFQRVRSAKHALELRELEPATTIGGGGLYGFCAGASQHLVMRAGITDPLLARLPRVVSEPFLPGHVPTPVPTGYLESLVTSENRIPSPDLARFWDELAQVTRGPLWTLERWHSILRMNTVAGRFLGPYQVADLPDPRPKRSLVERVRARRLD